MQASRSSVHFLILALCAITLPAWAQFHSGDSNQSGDHDLSEVLRVIQFFNGGGLSCADGTEDGFALGFDITAQDCPPHSSDYVDQNWLISLSELLRLIQFFNLAGYQTDCQTEDGFAPGVGPIFDCDAEGEGGGEAEIPSFTLAYAAGPGGSLTGDVEQTVLLGEDGTPVAAVPDTSFVFVDWTDGNPNAMRTDTDVMADLSVTANFVEQFTLTYAAGPGGSITGTTPQIVNAGEDGTAVTAVPDSNFIFVDWSDGNPNATRTDTNVMADLSVTANFVEQFTLTYTAGPGGSISGPTPQTVNAGEDGIAVTAVPDSDFIFVDWSDGNPNATRTDTNVMTDLSVTANFVEQFTLTYTAGPGGSITGTTPQIVNAGEDGTAVEAVPNPGSFFVDWSDGSIENPRTDTNVADDISVTANFVVSLPPAFIDVAADSFDMGRTSAGDDALFGGSDELPVHAVALSSYRIGRFEVMNQQVCDVYNWADDQGLFTTVNADTATAFGQELLDLDSPQSHIAYVDGVFQPEIRAGQPGGTDYLMAHHPVVEITWYGAAAFCNWLSEIQGLPPVYDTSTWTADFTNNGYHLPTEAQWERAAAWDLAAVGGPKHWVYGFTSDTLTGRDRANYLESSRVNPLGLFLEPPTSPVGWFDGDNVSPNGSIATVDSVSPIGAYDMSGNVFEWCHDWYDSGYYSVSSAADPRGAATGSERVVRGGSWLLPAANSRSAARGNGDPLTSNFIIGFRLARTTSYELSYTAGAGGTLTGDTDQTVLPGQNGTTVTARPAADYVFVDWSDGSTENPRTEFNVASGVSVTANFELQFLELVSVPAGSFDMGRTSAGDDATFGNTDELPVHTVTLSAYKIGTFEVTNQEVCDVFNWADDQGLFTTVDATTATAFGEELLDLDESESNIEYVGGLFQPKTRSGVDSADDPFIYSMADHPVVEVSWFGAVAFCNWLSQIEGRTPVYDTAAGPDQWTADFANDGYHLPTEAQWERAAAWDLAAVGGPKHWIYSFTSDTLTGSNRANYFNGSDNVNPLGLFGGSETSPVGWFDGDNVSPNGNVATVDSPSPVGAYDMSGNVSEWCHDWRDFFYYASSPGTDPEGPASGDSRVLRDGSWGNSAPSCRSAGRSFFFPTTTELDVGFRVAR